MALITSQFNRKDYPRVRYWSTKDWKEDSSDAMIVNELPATKGKSRVTKGINVTGRFVEEADGTIVNGHQISDMRYLATQVFNQLLKHNAAPPKFKSIQCDAFQFFLYEMYTNFPMLRLCEGHWKAIRLGSSTYSGWYRNHVSDPEGKAIKAEETTRENSAVPKKRPALTISTQALKKSRQAPLPTPIRSPTPDELEYVDDPLIDDVGTPAEQCADLPTPPLPPTPISLPTPTPIDLPTPLPTPTITVTELLENNTVSSVSGSTETATETYNTFRTDTSGSPLDILADVSGTVAKASSPVVANLDQIDSETSLSVLSITNPLYMSSPYLLLYSLSPTTDRVNLACRQATVSGTSLWIKVHSEIHSAACFPLIYNCRCCIQRKGEGEEEGRR
jgi:hypothetical protein